MDLNWLDDLRSLLDQDDNFMPQVVTPDDVAPEDDLNHHYHVTPAPPVVTQQYVTYGWRQVQQHSWVPYHGQYYPQQPVVSVRRAEANMDSSMDDGFSPLILSPFIA